MALIKVKTGGVDSTTNLGRRNLIINGAMQVAQRGTSNTTNGGHCVDRFKNQFSGGAKTFEQETLTSSTDATVWNLGFRNALKITNTTAGSSLTSDYTELNYWVESQDIANSGWNYLDENSYLTVSFWVKSSVASDYLFWSRCEDNTALQISQSFTVSAANTWEKIILKIKGNSGLIFNNDNGGGLRFAIFAYEGTGYTDGSPENTWQNGTPNSPSSTWSTTTNATFHVTGVQLEVGDTATPFEHRSFAEELQLCYRYYRLVGPYGDPFQTNGIGYFLGHSGSGMQNNEDRVAIPYWETTMRTSPSVTHVNFSNGGTGALTEFSSNTVRSQTGIYDVTPNGGGYAQFNANLTNPVRYRAIFDAEF